MPRTFEASSCFFRLPLELRREVYLQYLMTTYNPPAWMIYKHTRIDQSPPKSPVVGVSKQFQEELTSVVRQQRNFCYRISSQEATFDGLALSCFRLLKEP